VRIYQEAEAIVAAVVLVPHLLGREIDGESGFHRTGKHCKKGNTALDDFRKPGLLQHTAKFAAFQELDVFLPFKHTRV